MATVTELVDLICQDTGLDNTLTSTDRAVALARLNEAQKRIVDRTRCYWKPISYALTEGTQDYDVVSDIGLTDFHMIRSLWIVNSSGARTEPLTLAPDRRAQFSRAGTVSEGTPTQYAFSWPTLTLLTPPSASLTLAGRYDAVPPTLTEGGTISAVPAMYHERALAALAMVLILERYEGREQDATYHRNLYMEAEADLIQWAAMNGGGIPASYTPTRFSTSVPLGRR